MLSNKFIRFLEKQEEKKEVVEVSRAIKEVSRSLLNIKGSLGKKAAEFYLQNNEEGIQKLLDMGTEIDAYISELNVLDFVSDETDIVNQDNKKSRNNDQPELIKLQVVGNKICPNCKVPLIDSRTTYVEFADKRKRRVEKTQIAATYECPECERKYIHKQMESLIDISRTNIEIVDEGIAE